MGSQVPIARPQKSDSPVMGAGRACYESVNIAFELHLGDAWRLEVKLAEQRVLSLQHHACGVPVAKRSGRRRAVPSDVQIEILYYGVCHSNGPFKVELPPIVLSREFFVIVSTRWSRSSRLYCYMLPKQGYLSDRDGHWHPHLMFFTPLTDPLAWGAGLPASPVLGFRDDPARLTVFLIPVGKWPDGTADHAAEN